MKGKEMSEGGARRFSNSLSSHLFLQWVFSSLSLSECSCDFTFLILPFSFPPSSPSLVLLLRSFYFGFWRIRGKEKSKHSCCKFPSLPHWETWKKKVTTRFCMFFPTSSSSHFSLILWNSDGREELFSFTCHPSLTPVVVHDSPPDT